MEIEECRVAHLRLLSTIADVTEEQARQPALLPGWTRAHVLSHLATNAESVIRRLTMALEGYVVEQYPGGATGRRQEIELGAVRPLAELVDEVRRSSSTVDELFTSYPEDGWERLISAVDGPDRPARLAVFSRWREVEAHHVDLDLGYGVADWPSSLVDRWLPRTIDGLAARANANELLGWLLGRGPAPVLEPWG
jgi:maleylpyruvate isomerase